MTQQKIEDASVYYNRLGQSITALRDWYQRTCLFATKIMEIEPRHAVPIADTILRDGFTKRELHHKIVLEALVISLVKHLWDAGHANETLRLCYFEEKRLASIFLNGLRGIDRKREIENLPQPEYTKDRPLTLGERRAIARKPDRHMLKLAMRDPHPMVMTNLLENPRLTEDDIVFVASRRPASPESLSEIAVHPRFRGSRRLARALINNPALRTNMALSLLPALDAPYLRELLKNRTLNSLLRDAIDEILSLRQK